MWVNSGNINASICFRLFPTTDIPANGRFAPEPDIPQKSAFDPGCVKTSMSRERAELFSPFAFFDGARQRCSFLIQLIRDKRSTRKSDFGVFTQPGPGTDLALERYRFKFPRRDRSAAMLPSAS
jgi:hypothetical protein